jgi:hypothetical protein
MKYHDSGGPPGIGTKQRVQYDLQYHNALIITYLEHRSGPGRAPVWSIFSPH